MAPRAVQTQLRQAFRRWGRPEHLRVDNGLPWGSSGDLPTDLALWLIGLGVAVDWNPPRRPQDNGVVERSQGTAKRWAEPHACASPAQLQRRLKEMDGIQRQEYPSVHGLSRWEAFPSLVHSGRTYTSAWEKANWNLALVAASLAGYTMRRRVDVTGTVSLYNRNYYIGKVHHRTVVHVMFDPQTFEWIFADEQGRELRHRRACEISQARILDLKVTHRRPRKED